MPSDTEQWLSAALFHNENVLSAIHDILLSEIAHHVPAPVVAAVASSHLNEILLDEWVLLTMTLAPLVVFMLRICNGTISLSSSCCCNACARAALLSYRTLCSWCGSCCSRSHPAVAAAPEKDPHAPTFPLPPGSTYPFTRAQLAALEAALAAQTVLVAAAESVLDEEKAREDARWPRNGGRAIERLLEATPLVDLWRPRRLDQGPGPCRSLVPW